MFNSAVMIPTYRYDWLNGGNERLEGEIFSLFKKVSSVDGSSPLKFLIQRLIDGN